MTKPTHTIIGPPEIVAFNPNKGAQSKFLRSKKKERWFFAGNRGGKTFVGTRDIGLDMTGLHRFRPRFGRTWDPEKEFAERAKRGTMVWWACAPDYPNNWRPTIMPYFREMLRPLNAVWKSQDHVFVFHVKVQGPSGKIYEWDCEIHAKSYEAGRSKFQSAGIAGVWFDEEPPYDIYEESIMRVAKEWDLWITGTMTPVLGMTWVYRDIFEPVSAKDGHPWQAVFLGHTLENKENLPKEEIKSLMARFPEGSPERTIRLEGRFLRRSGLIWSEFNRDVHVIPDFDPNKAGPGTWTLYRGIDLGWNNPTAVVWAAVNRENEVFIYREYYERDRNLADHATAIRVLSGDEAYRYSVVDPAARQTDPVTGTSLLDTMIQYGVPCIPGDNNVPKGITKVAEYFRINEETKRPKLFICECCHNLIREVRSYHYQTQTSRAKDTRNPVDKPQKKDDHLADAIRYLLMSTPKHFTPILTVKEEQHAEWDDTGY